MRGETIKTFDDFSTVLIQQTVYGEKGAGIIPEIMSIGKRLETLSKKLDEKIELISVVTNINRQLRPT